MVRDGDASVDDGVSHRLVGVVVAHLGSEAPLLTLLGSLGHLVEPVQVVRDGRLPSTRGDPVEPLVPHLLLEGVVAVGVAVVDELDRNLVQLVKVVRRVRDRVKRDVEQLEVLLDRVLKLGLRLRA